MNGSVEGHATDACAFTVDSFIGQAFANRLAAVNGSLSMHYMCEMELSRGSVGDSTVAIVVGCVVGVVCVSLLTALVWLRRHRYHRGVSCCKRGDAHWELVHSLENALTSSSESYEMIELVEVSVVVMIARVCMSSLRRLCAMRIAAYKQR